MNVTFAGFAGRPDEWAKSGNEKGAANLVEYQKLGSSARSYELAQTIPVQDRARRLLDRFLKEEF